ncbi:hypothetical protein CMK14_00670 [Candidatus Poribacteria bacterium]|nr:hypothetical protein [Candidatus Poribacteria bacterium]
MTSWAGCVCLFRPFNWLLTNIDYHRLNLGLLIQQLSFARQVELLALDQSIFHLVLWADARLTGVVG